MRNEGREKGDVRPHERSRKGVGNQGRGERQAFDCGESRGGREEKSSFYPFTQLNFSGQSDLKTTLPGPAGTGCGIALFESCAVELQTRTCWLAA